MQFKQNLKKLRLSSSFMQKELASLLGVSVRTFQGWETGRAEPNIQKLIKIANIFQVSLDDLVGRSFTPSLEADAVEDETDLPTCPNE